MNFPSSQSKITLSLKKTSRLHLLLTATSYTFPMKTRLAYIILSLCTALSSLAFAAEADIALHRGIKANNPTLVSQAIADGAELNMFSSTQSPPLVMACRLGVSKQILQSLINAGASLNRVNLSTEAPIFACMTDTPKASHLKLLCQSGAELNIRNFEGHTPLTLALKKNYSPSLISLLLQSGASANFPADLSHRKIYPLTLSVILHSSPEIISLLLPVSSPDAAFQALTVVSVTDDQNIRRLFEQHGLLQPRTQQQ